MAPLKNRLGRYLSAGAQNWRIDDAPGAHDRPTQVGALNRPPFICRYAADRIASSPAHRAPTHSPNPSHSPRGVDRSRQAVRYLQRATLSAQLRGTLAVIRYLPAFRSNRWGAAKLAAPRFAPPYLSATAQNSA